MKSKSSEGKGIKIDYDKFGQIGTIKEVKKRNKYIGYCSKCHLPVEDNGNSIPDGAFKVKHKVCMTNQKSLDKGKGIKEICPYCGKEAKWCENKEVYGKNYGKSYMCYWCKDCGAYVGCHNNTTKPLGTMANKELRDWRIKAHEMFDKLWKDGLVTRKEAYKILDDEFGKEIHIGESDIETCQRIINLLEK